MKERESAPERDGNASDGLQPYSNDYWHCDGPTLYPQRSTLFTVPTVGIPRLIQFGRHFTQSDFSDGDEEISAKRKVGCIKMDGRPSAVGFLFGECPCSRYFGFNSQRSWQMNLCGTSAHAICNGGTRPKANSFISESDAQGSFCDTGFRTTNSRMDDNNAESTFSYHGDVCERRWRSIGCGDDQMW